MGNDYDSCVKHIMLHYELKTGSKKSVMLTPEQVQEWMTCFREQKPFIAKIGKIVRGIHPSSVSEFDFESEQVDYFDGPIDDYAEGFSKHARLKAQVKDQEEVVLETQTSSTEPARVKRKIYFQASCKCGSEFDTVLSASTKAYKCKRCDRIMFTDYAAGIIDTKFGKGLRLTNTRSVNRTSPPPPDLESIIIFDNM